MALQVTHLTNHIERRSSGMRRKKFPVLRGSRSLFIRLEINKIYSMGFGRKPNRTFSVGGRQTQFIYTGSSIHKFYLHSRNVVFGKTSSKQIKSETAKQQNYLSNSDEVVYGNWMTDFSHFSRSIWRIKCLWLNWCYWTLQLAPLKRMFSCLYQSLIAILRSSSRPKNWKGTTFFCSEIARYF